MFFLKCPKFVRSLSEVSNDSTTCILMITYRQAISSDAEVLLETRRSAVLGSHTQAYSRTILEAWAPAIDAGTIQKESERLLDSDMVTIVAEEDEKIVGICTLGISEGLLKQCYVLPEYTGRGIARELVKQVETIAKNHGLQLLRLSSSLIARSFYRREGYGELNSYEYDLGNGKQMTCLMMEKLF